GLDDESVAPVYFDLKNNKHCIIIGQTQRGKTNETKLMLDQLLVAKPQKLAVFESIDRGLSQ
ncbi:FtsK/SpoIIIE domain-containing protein, partial [Bacillus sp. PsM16]